MQLHLHSPHPQLHCAAHTLPRQAQLFVLDGAAYDQRLLGESGRRGVGGQQPAGGLPDAEVDACALLTNNKGQPLLAALTGGRADDAGRLLLQTVVRTGGGSGKLLLCMCCAATSPSNMLTCCHRNPALHLVLPAVRTAGSCCQTCTSPTAARRCCRGASRPSAWSCARATATAGRSRRCRPSARRLWSPRAACARRTRCAPAAQLLCHRPACAGAACIAPPSFSHACLVVIHPPTLLPAPLLAG